MIKTNKESIFYSKIILKPCEHKNINMDNQNNHNPFVLELGISILTPPILLGLRISREMGGMMDSLGKASEEIFRGQHLPILKSQPKT
nr:hypothetical protein A5482_11625 [Cyanobacterium sp. IPPAS B-1200]